MVALKNINFMSQERYDSIESSDEELYAVEVNIMTPPDYANKVEITSGYIAPNNGYIVAHNRSGDVNLRLYVEGLELGGAQTAHGGACAAFATVAKGNTITYTGNNVIAYFIPCL